MKKTFLILFFTILVSLLAAQQNIAPWLNLQNSGYTSQDSICISYETVDIEQQQRVFASTNGTNWQQYNTFQNQFDKTCAWVPYNASTGTHWRVEFESNLTYTGMMPFVSSNPSITDYAKCGNDSLNDSNVDGANNLDIKAQYFAYNDSKYMVCLENNSNGFPSSGGFTGPFYLYIVALANPTSVVTDSTAYAFVYANLFSVISPGLYKIDLAEIMNNPTGAFTRIANINHSVQGNKLFMDCNINDIANNEGENWPPLNNFTGLISLTIQIDVESIMPLNVTPTIADYSKPAVIQLNDKHIEPFANTTPTISLDPIEITRDEEDDYLYCFYNDAEKNFPLKFEVRTVNNNLVQPEVLAWNFENTTAFKMLNTNSNDPISRIIVSDDNQNETEIFIITSTSNNVQNKVNPVINLGPNPFTPAKAKLRIVAENASKIEGAVYNIKGQKVKSFKAKQNQYVWNGTCDNGQKAASGIYFVKVKNRNIQKVKKLLIIR